MINKSISRRWFVNTVGAAFLILVGFVVALWVSAYVNVTGAGFYERVMEKYRAQNAPPVGPQPPEY